MILDEGSKTTWASLEGTKGKWKCHQILYFAFRFCSLKAKLLLSEDLTSSLYGRRH